MSIIGFNQDSLKRHKISERECYEALSDECRQEVEYGESKNGNPTIMWLGITHRGRLLEVGVEYLPGMDWAFHIDDAKAHYRKMYIKKIGRIL